MSATTDLDAILRAWLSEGADRAPAQPLRVALDATLSMPQRRPMHAPRQIARPAWARSLIVAAAAALLVAIGVGIGVQSGLIRIPQPNPPTPNVASPSLAPTPAPTLRPAEGRPFIAPDGTFQIQLPAQWRQVSGLDPTALYLATERFELSIRAGDADGSVRMCDEGAGPWEICSTTNATTLDELADAVTLQPVLSAEWGEGPLYRSMTLAGEPARVKVMVAAEPTASGQQSVKYIVAMHGGRPFVLRLWARDNGALDSVVPLLEHFSFVHPEPQDSPDATAEPGAADLRTFRAQDGSFVIRLPAGWEERSGPDPSAIYLRNGTVSLSIRAGDEDGRIRTCDTLGAVPFESCPLITATTLDDLADAIAVSEGQYPQLGPNEAARTLGGEPATSITVISGVSPPVGVLYVVAVHDGRPFIVRARQDRPPDPLFDVLRALEGFEFR